MTLYADNILLYRQVESPQDCQKLQDDLYHDAWMDEKYRHSIYSLYTLAQPFIFPYTLGCMVARTTNALAVANGPPTVWETLAN